MGLGALLQPALSLSNHLATHPYAEVQYFEAEAHTSAMSSRRVQGWDPILIICQIIALQSLHYLVLSLLTPPVLSTFSPSLTYLEHQGGPATVSVVMDWREMASRPTFSAPVGSSGHGEKEDGHDRTWMELFGGAWSGGRKVSGDEDDKNSEDWIGGWDGRIDRRRGWLLAGCWAVASCFDVLFLYHLIRRPTYILDHALTLTFVHLLLTTYYTAAFPSSLFWWLVIGVSSIGTVVWAEQLCVTREMQESLGDWSGAADSGGGGEGENEALFDEEREEEMEMGKMGASLDRT